MRLMVGRGGTGVFACQCVCVCVFRGCTVRLCFLPSCVIVIPILLRSAVAAVSFLLHLLLLFSSLPPSFTLPSLSLSFSFTRLPLCCCFCSCCCCCRCWDTHHYTALLEKARGSHSLLQYFIFFLELCPLSLSPHFFHTLSQMKMSAEEETLSNG